MPKFSVYSKNCKLRFDLVKPKEWHSICGRFMILRERAQEHNRQRQRTQYGFDADPPIKWVSYEREAPPTSIGEAFDKDKGIWHVLSRFGEDTLNEAIEDCANIQESDEARKKQ